MAISCLVGRQVGGFLMAPEGKRELGVWLSGRVPAKHLQDPAWPIKTNKQTNQDHEVKGFPYLLMALAGHLTPGPMFRLFRVSPL